MQHISTINSVSPKHCYDHNIQTRSFNIGDMVLRRIQDETGLHKLNSRWEGSLPTDLRGRTRSPQLMEHRASQEVLPISCQRLPPGFQSSIKKHDPSEFNSSTQDSFRSRYSIDYLEYQSFFVHSKSKARRIE